MKKLRWKDEYSVGVRHFDQHHEELFMLINELANEDRVHSPESCSEILNRLVKYAESHFSQEEALMEQIGYADLELQKKEHMEFLERVFELHQKMVEQGEKILPELIIFLKDWMISHILGVDKEYAVFFKAKNIH